jgi:hypothetical protein
MNFRTVLSGIEFASAFNFQTIDQSKGRTKAKSFREEKRQNAKAEFWRLR